MSVIERKSYVDVFASQRHEHGQREMRLDAQLEWLRTATEFTSRLRIVQKPIDEWKHDRSAYADLVGLRIPPQILQSQFGDFDVRRLPAIRVIRVRSSTEDAKAVSQLTYIMSDLLLKICLYI